MRVCCCCWPLVPSNFLSVFFTPSDPVGTVGSSINLTCTAMLSVNVPEAMFSFDYRFMNNSVLMIPDSMQSVNIFMISPVAISSAGDYDCTVTVTVSGVCGGGGSEPACPTMTSDDVTLTVRCELWTYMYAKYVPNIAAFYFSTFFAYPIVTRVKNGEIFQAQKNFHVLFVVDGLVHWKWMCKRLWKSIFNTKISY